MTYRIAVDVGGTFTDVVGVDDQGRITFVKAPSTPQNQAEGTLDGINRLAAELGLKTRELLGQTERIVHGMTVATNALLERKGAKVGLVTTAGHRDVLEMREGLKPERYNMRLARQTPLVPRHLRFEVDERLRADGRVERPLERQSVLEAVDAMKAENVTSVAVCYLHAYRDPIHEQATRDIIQHEMPGAHVSLSSDVLPQIKEYERVSTTVVNAYVGPLIEAYLARLEGRLKEAGLAGPLLIILSHGGVAPVEEAVRVAASTVLSGPAGGLAGGRRVAGIIGAPDLITFDVGGTSSDIALITGGEASLSRDRMMAGERIALPSLDIVTLGAGGGSIARRQTSGLLEVGPESAGAVPGPVCYGGGGTVPTVTDASVVLGLLDPDNFAGGQQQLDRAAAITAFEKLGAELGVNAFDAAAGVHRVVNTQLAEGIRIVTVRRGVDPRRFALLGFGGAAGVHVTELARMLGIKRVIVPRAASVLSAWGMLATELRLESVRTSIGETDRQDMKALRGLYDEMDEVGARRMASWFDGEVVQRHGAEMRYGEQVFEIDVSLQDIDFARDEDNDIRAKLKTAFEQRHDELYAYHLPEQNPVIVNARVATVGVLPELQREPAMACAERLRGEHADEAAPTRQVYLDGAWVSASVHRFDRVQPGATIQGPALVESETTTVLLRDNDSVTATPEQWLDIAVGASE